TLLSLAPLKAPAIGRNRDAVAVGQRERHCACVLAAGPARAPLDAGAQPKDLRLSVDAALLKLVFGFGYVASCRTEEHRDGEHDENRTERGQYEQDSIHSTPFSGLLNPSGCSSGYAPKSSNSGATVIYNS